MDLDDLSRITPGSREAAELWGSRPGSKVCFADIMDSCSSAPVPAETAASPSPETSAPRSNHAVMATAPPLGTATAAYEKHAPSNNLSDWEKYRDDQLLSNPGGDNYYLDEKRVEGRPQDQESLWGRVKKDLSDAAANVKNFFDDLLFGSETHYRDEKGRIQEAGRRGVLGSIVDFFKDLGSAFTFGAGSAPAGEKAPQGFAERAWHFVSKIKKAFLGDLFQGVPGAVLHMGEDLILAGWNLVEVVPDATIGNFEAGRKATTALFDNGQVVIDYLTDILPTQEAWLRVHAYHFRDRKLPIYYNLGMPERYTGDARWSHVRNTPFRKGIETAGALLGDIFTVKLLDEASASSEAPGDDK
jgi:hypothetical protein